MYTYENPVDKGCKQFKLTKQQHNQLFPYRQRTWKNKFEYYYNDKVIILHNFSSVPVIIINTLLFPVYVVVHGIGNFKELIKEYKRLFNEKKYGSFVSDTVWSKTEIYDDIMKLINKGEK